jgi:AraC-like DNA-binding protein
MPTAVSTDQVRPAERHAFWTEAICRTFASVETRPIASAAVSGHFEYVEMGEARLVRFDSSPQCYRRDARLVSRDGADEFMFDFQRCGQSSLTQGANEGTIAPGFGVLYDARRPFEDALYGEDGRAEVLIATVPAAALLRACPEAERFCARPVPLSGHVARAIAGFVRAAISEGRDDEDADIAAYLAALLRLATGAHHELSRANLFGLLDAYLKANISSLSSAPAISAKFAISERSLHRIFADRKTTFERHVLQIRARLFRKLLREASLAGISIASLASQCGFADAAHASRTFRQFYGLTPRQFRAS